MCIRDEGERSSPLFSFLLGTDGSEETKDETGDGYEERGLGTR